MSAVVVVIRKRTNFMVEAKRDWCHFCGVRDLTNFVCVDGWENAEHAVLFPKRRQNPRYHRICAECVVLMSELLVSFRMGEDGRKAGKS